MSRALIVLAPEVSWTPPDGGDTSDVPNVQIAGIYWQPEGNVFSAFHPDGSGDFLALKRIGTDGAKFAYACACTDGCIAKLSQLGADAQLLTAWYADPTLNAKAVGWGVEENADANGFVAPHCLAGVDPVEAGRNYA